MKFSAKIHRAYHVYLGFQHLRLFNNAFPKIIFFFTMPREHLIILNCLFYKPFWRYYEQAFFTKFGICRPKVASKRTTKLSFKTVFKTITKGTVVIKGKLSRESNNSLSQLLASWSTLEGTDDHHNAHVLLSLVSLRCVFSFLRKFMPVKTGRIYSL